MESYGGKDEVVSEGEKEDDEEEGRESDRDESDGDEEVIESTSRSPGDDHPFILPEEWTINDILPTMLDKVFKTLRARFQIPDNIPIRLPGKFEKCYTGKTANVGMYDAMFATGLKLPLTALHCQLANFLGFSINQIAPNAWRIFIRAKILSGHLSGGNRQLTLNEFFWCYRPQHIVSSQGIYHFSARKKELRLMSDMPESNRNWKGRYFFVKGTNWVCCQEEWETMPHGFDNTWAFVKDSG